MLLANPARQKISGRYIMDFIRVGHHVINVSLITHVNFSENEATISFANMMPGGNFSGENSRPNKVDQLRFTDQEADVVRDYFTRNSEDLRAESSPARSSN
ncbi:MAG: hypothetical protein JWP00_2111 [Chloroflexi bacterium]|nr:hypothetical protein [Chloroflexota bacterium]